MAQDAGGPTTRPGPGGGRRNFNPEQFQKMISDRLKERMGVSDEDWAAIEPGSFKVMAAQRDAGSGEWAWECSSASAARAARRTGGPGAVTSKLSPTAKAAKDLQASIEANAGPEEMASQMAAYP